MANKGRATVGFSNDLDAAVFDMLQVLLTPQNNTKTALWHNYIDHLVLFDKKKNRNGEMSSQVKCFKLFDWRRLGTKPYSSFVLWIKWTAHIQKFNKDFFLLDKLIFQYLSCQQRRLFCFAVTRTLIFPVSMRWVGFRLCWSRTSKIFLCSCGSTTSWACTEVMKHWCWVSLLICDCQG